MANNINVALDMSVTPPALDVQDHGGKNHVSVGSGSQTISWELTGNLARGAFQPITSDPSTSGFAWLDPQPAAGIFGTPTVGAGGNSLDISDNYTSQNAGTNAGQWTYVLRVMLGTVVYCTEGSVQRIGTIKDPIIINR
jgi:hypothetical protein